MTAPAIQGTSVAIAGTGSSNNNTFTPTGEISTIPVFGFLSGGGIARPTVTMTGETVVFEDEGFFTFSTSGDQYGGLFFVDSPVSESKTVTVAFSSATNGCSFVIDWVNIGTSSAPFTATSIVEGDGTDANPTTSAAGNTDSTGLSASGAYDETRSSINDGGTSFHVDENEEFFLSAWGHYIAGSTTITSDITLSSTSQWMTILGVLGGTGGAVTSLVYNPNPMRVHLTQ